MITPQSSGWSPALITEEQDRMDKRHHLNMMSGVDGKVFYDLATSVLKLEHSLPKDIVLRTRRELETFLKNRREFRDSLVRSARHKLYDVEKRIKDVKTAGGSPDPIIQEEVRWKMEIVRLENLPEEQIAALR